MCSIILNQEKLGTVYLPKHQCVQLGSMGCTAIGGKILSIFLTPIASYIFHRQNINYVTAVVDVASCNSVCAIVILCDIENILGSATGKISTLSSKSNCLMTLAPPTTSYG